MQLSIWSPLAPVDCKHPNNLDERYERRTRFKTMREQTLDKILFASILMGLVFNYLMSIFQNKLNYDYNLKLLYLVLSVIFFITPLFPDLSGGFNFSRQDRIPPWSLFGTGVFRPHGSLQLVEICKMFQRTCA